MLWLGMMLLLLAASCKDDNDNNGQVNLTFKSTFDTAPLVMYDEQYPYYDNLNLKFQLFQFYVSDVVLVPDDATSTTATPHTEIALISYKDVLNQSAAQQGITISADKIPAGKYKAVRFGLGVAPRFNATNPGNYTPPHPLDDHYWSAMLGYVFMKIEGNADNDGDGQFTDKLTFHIGANSLYRNMEFPIALEVKDGQTATVNFSVDLRRVLAVGPGDFLDVRTVTQDHTSNPEVYNYLYDNLEQAVKLQ